MTLLLGHFYVNSTFMIICTFKSFLSSTKDVWLIVAQVPAGHMIKLCTTATNLALIVGVIIGSLSERPMFQSFSDYKQSNCFQDSVNKHNHTELITLQPSL